MKQWPNSVEGSFLCSLVHLPSGLGLQLLESRKDLYSFPGSLLRSSPSGHHLDYLPLGPLVMLWHFSDTILFPKKIPSSGLGPEDVVDFHHELVVMQWFGSWEDELDQYLMRHSGCKISWVSPGLWMLWIISIGIYWTGVRRASAAPES